MKRQHATLSSFLTALLLAALLYACRLPADSGGDEEHPPLQTKILDVKVKPDTVAPGDTASFTCVIEDSLDKRFKFYWLIDKGQVLGAEFIGGNYSAYKSNTNSIRWIAPNLNTYYHFTVYADNGSKDSLSVQYRFLIVVE